MERTLAEKLVMNALEEARSRDLAPLAVAVLDRGRDLVAFAREDRAAPLRNELATNKAWSALALGMNSAMIAEIGKERPEFFAALTGLNGCGRVIPAAGGVLLYDGERLIGAIGISGDASEQDEACCFVAAGRSGLTVGKNRTAK